MMPRLHLLLALSSFALFGLGVSVWALIRHSRRESAYRRRVDRVVQVHVPASSDHDTAPLRLGIKLPSGTVRQKCAALVGYDSVRKDHHPLSWQIALGMALIPSYCAERLASSYIGYLGWVGFAVTWIFICRKFFKWSDQRLAAVLYRQFPDALAMIVRSVRVGIPVSEAIRVVGREAVEPTSGEFVRVGHELSIGVPLDRALRDLADRSGLPEYRFFATALALQSQTGGALGETLESLADTIRKRVAARARGRALAAEARASALVLTGLPVAVGALLFVINPGYMSLLVADPAGQRALGLAGSLLVVGTVTMRSMIRKSLT